MLFLVSLLLLFTVVLGQLPVRRSESHEKRIIGGEFIPVHHIPHQAVIRNSLGGRDFQCGAILIAPEWLLTAKHCLQYPDLNEAPIDAYLGISREEQIDSYSPNRTEGVVKRRVVRYFRSPWIEIGNRIEWSDLLLLKLDQKVTFSTNIKPIELPEVGTRWMSNQTAVTSGFGLMHDYDRYRPKLQPVTLQYVKMPILSKIDCLAMHRKKYPHDYHIIRFKVSPESILCAGYEEGGRSDCFGDSGGPLAVCATPLRNPSGGELLCKDNRWRLAGVISASASNRCGDPNSPTILSNVPVFTEWVRRTMRNN